MNKKLLVVSVVVLATIGCFYLLFVHHEEAYQVGIGWNRVSGEIYLDQRAGYHLTPPWVQITRIDTRPQRVCVTSTARGYNCKLVRFEPGAWQEFVSVQGFHYYWLANRISFNVGYSEEYRG